MDSVLDLIFDSFVDLWSLIKSSWILAFPTLLGVMGLIVSLVKGSRES